MKSLVRLSCAAVVVAYGEVLLGSWTRINGAGLTCPDYPLCRGRLIPVFQGGTVWEWTHRLTAAALCILVLLVVAKAWKRGADAPYVRSAAAAVAALFMLQVVLGAATVRLMNSPTSVVWHWGTAMALVAALAALAIFAHAASSPQRFAAGGAVTAALAISALATFATMCIGAYVSSSGAGLACLSIPGCAGSVVVYGNGQFVQMLHRFAAGGTLIVAVAAFAMTWIRHAPLAVRAWASAGLALIFVQILLGLMNVALRLPIDLREAHAANAALTFLCFVCATTLAWLASTRRELAAA